MQNSHTDTNNDKLNLTKEQIRVLKSKYSTTTTYCKHSGVKLVISTEFQNSFLRGKLIKHSHYVFGLTQHELLRLAKSHLYKGNPTERALVTNAILHKLNLVDTTKQPLMLSESTTDRLTKIINALVKVWSYYDGNNIEFPLLPKLMVNYDNCDSFPVLVSSLRSALERLETHNFQTHLNTRSAERQVERDYDNELNQVQQFQAILDNYNAKTQPKSYTRKIGKWATKQLALHCPDMSQDKIDSINYYIQTDSIKLDNTILKSYIKLLEEVLPMDDEHYETSHLVIRHLNSKLETINKELADYGFILLENEEIIVGGKVNQTNTSNGMKYQAKTKVIETGIGMPTKVAKSQRTTSTNVGAKLGGTGSALARMMAKYSSKPSTTTNTNTTTKV